MSKKETNLSKGKGQYKWQYCSLGGTKRVCITRGEDIAHLGELDQKLWTVLSCPVKGLELDERTLDLIDYDRDGKIRADEVITAADWLCSVVKDKNKILQGHDYIDLSDFNTDNEEGVQMRDCAAEVLKIFRLKKHRFSDSLLRGWSGNVSPTALELCYSSPGVLLQDSWSDVTGLLEKSYGGLGKK